MDKPRARARAEKKLPRIGAGNIRVRRPTPFARPTADPYPLEVVASVEFELFRVGQHFQFVKYVVQPRVFRGDIGHGTL